MILFNLFMLNEVWNRRYDKLPYEDKESIYMFFVLIESLILWTIGCFLIIKG